MITVIRCLQKPEVISLTEDNEKRLLISLSQVLREIQLWIDELDCDSGSVSPVSPSFETLDETVENRCSMLHSEDMHCLTAVVVDLIVLITVKSQYVQHLVGNVLVNISEFLAASGSQWSVFVHLVCASMECVITNMLSGCGLTSMTRLEQPDIGPSSFDIVLKRGLESCNWTTVTGAICVLRNILKNRNQSYDDQHVKVLLESINSSIFNIPWYHFDDMFGKYGEAMKNSCSDALALKTISGQEQRIAFLSHFLQFLCSVVEKITLLEASEGSQTPHPILLKIINLLPRLLSWCLSKLGGSFNKSISQYFRHKLLVLMTRISFQCDLECSVLVNWLQNLENYFQDLLQQPIIHIKSCQDDCLDGSPFSLCNSDESKSATHSLHLQRLAIFLFLRCSFNLIGIGGDGDKKHTCATQKSCLSFDSISTAKNYCADKGLLDLYDWIEVQFQTEICRDHNMYFDKCVHFALSFLQLYMHEDDLLFKMLLQLHIVPFPIEGRVHKGKWTLNNAKEDTLFHVSNLFNPSDLFHLFLSELHYDHQVLLDYLISKDTGLSCAEYLLKCLRMVCNSWCLFVDFPSREMIDESSQKKRKFLLEDSNIREEISSSAPASKPFSPQGKELMGEKYGCKMYQTTGKPFNDAMSCLLSLKKSIENLHSKNIFPYNPKVLLKRLKRFEELCFNL